ncbi:hypothetical protein FWD20_00815 [Candidatus Saccharibacteria bacterium]|nr:hypothetical protein [Candidatus Saccharibacteria bacterium]
MKKFPLLILALIGVLLIGGSLVLKISATKSTESPAVQIHVTPIEVNLALDPGEVYNGKFQVRNNGTDSYDFHVTANRFYVKDLTYETTYDEESAHTQIAEWIKFTRTDFYGLEPGEKQEVAYRISVPEDAPGGGQYAVLFATVSTESSGGGYEVVTDSRVGVKIYAKLAGETHIDGRVESLKQAGFYKRGPIESIARVKNTGNVDFDSTHEFVIKSLNGRELFRDEVTKRIMPDTVREVKLKWWEDGGEDEYGATIIKDGTPTFGIFRVQNKISFLGKVQYTGEKIVIVAPIWLIIILTMALLLIIGLIFLLILFIVKKNRHKKIFEQHQKPHGDS